MSTKSTILLSKDNEHWYYECIDDSFVFEVNKEHCSSIKEDVEEIVVCKGTMLHRAIATSIMKGIVCTKCGHSFGIGYHKNCCCGNNKFYVDSIIDELQVTSYE